MCVVEFQRHHLLWAGPKQSNHQRCALFFTTWPKASTDKARQRITTYWQTDQKKIREVDTFELSSHPICSLVPSDFHIFLSMSHFLRGRNIGTFDDVDMNCHEFFFFKRQGEVLSRNRTTCGKMGSNHRFKWPLLWKIIYWYIFYIWNFGKNASTDESL